MTNPTPDEAAGKAAAERLNEQTPVYPTTKVTKLRPQDARIKVVDGKRHVALTPSQVAALYRAEAVVDLITGHATDGSEDAANQIGQSLPFLLSRYPVEWVDPKPK